MVKYIFIKSPDEWATTKQTCRDKRVVRLNLFLYLIYIYKLVASVTEPNPSPPLDRLGVEKNVYGPKRYCENQTHQNSCHSTCLKLAYLELCYISNQIPFLLYLASILCSLRLFISNSYILNPAFLELFFFLFILVQNFPVYLNEPSYELLGGIKNCATKL